MPTCCAVLALSRYAKTRTFLSRDRHAYATELEVPTPPIVGTLARHPDGVVWHEAAALREPDGVAAGAAAKVEHARPRRQVMLESVAGDG